MPFCEEQPRCSEQITSISRRNVLNDDNGEVGFFECSASKKFDRGRQK
jgi:hypothetical protein